MELNSSIYRCKVYHDRRKPKKNSFSYNVFMFSIDLDEIELLARKFTLFGYNSFNVFSFFDKDHFKKSKTEQQGQTIKQKLEEYLIENGIKQPKNVKLVTHLRVLGYVFNPVSFYYCYDSNGNVYCVIAEVTNTYGEMKMYLLESEENGYFQDVRQKLFYISPFTQLDDFLKLKIGLPGKKLKVYIDDFKDAEIKIKTVLSGKKQKLTNLLLLKYIFRFPLITLQIISLIHWQALKLWLKGVKYIPKHENLHLQKDIYFRKNNASDETITLQKNSAEHFRQNEARKAHTY